MTDKPKKWTWKEWYFEESSAPSLLKANPLSFAFHANEPYIDHLEKEVERYYTEIKELRGVIYRHEYATIPELKQRIEYIKHQWNSERDLYTKKNEEMREIITRLRAALEFYADPRNYRNVVSILRKEDQPLNDDLTWLNIDSEYLPNFKANCGGVKARTALKECFEGKDGT